MDAVVYGEIITQVGKKTDSASATGNVHEKLGAIYSKSAIKSIQRGEIVILSDKSSATATISAVNTAKAMLNFLGASSSDRHKTSEVYSTWVGYALTGHHFARINLASATTVTASRDESGSEATISYEVIEFY